MNPTTFTGQGGRGHGTPLDLIYRLRIPTIISCRILSTIVLYCCAVVACRIPTPARLLPLPSQLSTGSKLPTTTNSKERAQRSYRSTAGTASSRPSERAATAWSPRPSTPRLRARSPSRKSRPWPLTPRTPSMSSGRSGSCATWACTTTSSRSNP